MKHKKYAYIALNLLAASFLLNFLWESVHGFSLYQEHIIPSDRYVRMMLYMSSLDALTIFSIYLVMAFFKKNLLWIETFQSKETLQFLCAAIFIAAVAEYWAVYVAGEWQYNVNMPLVFGIGLSPLVQLAVTGLVSLWVTKKIVR